jgi:4-aminobutyrate aminotransferase-like enzyme
MTMQTADVTQLKQEALDKVIFHMTPKQWLTESGAWVLDRGEGALLYDVDGREYLDAMAGDSSLSLPDTDERRSPGPCTTRRSGCTTPALPP